MLPRYRLDFTRDVADQMACGELANDGDGVHLLTIGLVPFAVTLVASHFGGDNSAHHNSCDFIFFRRVLPLERPSSIAAKPNASLAASF